MIELSPGVLTGEITIQPSKSYLHRMMICAALSRKKVRIDKINQSDDVLATLQGLQSLGLCRYQLDKDAVDMLPGGEASEAVVDCKECGSTLRFLLPVALTLGRPVTFAGKGRLFSRPLFYYEELCQEKGFVYKKGEQSITVQGELQAGDYLLPGNLSSQFITGMLLALSQLDGTSRLMLTGEIESLPYVKITLDVLSWFGVDCRMEGREIQLTGGYTQHPDRLVTPGDWSHGAFFAVAGAIGGRITLKGLDGASVQGDREILSLLQRMGARMDETKKDIVLFPSDLSGIQADVRNIPDLAPILAVAMAGARGESRITHGGRLRLKECDRFAAILQDIQALGGEARAMEDTIVIQGRGRLSGGRVESYHDHRMAMSMAIAAGLCDQPVILDDERCVEKSAPRFWQEYAQLGGRYVCRG